MALVQMLQFAKPVDELVFNAYAQMSKQIDLASKAITEHFSVIDSALDSGLSVREAASGQRIQMVMHRVVASSRLAGFQHGAIHAKKKMPGNYGHVIHDAARDRASEVNRLMRRTTKRRLKETPDSEYILSSDRAMAAARYEAGRSYFEGVADAFKGSAWGKAWITSSSEPCIECEEAESQGVIGADMMFNVGQSYPPLHLHCACSITMRRL